MAFACSSFTKRSVAGSQVSGRPSFIAIQLTIHAEPLRWAIAAGESGCRRERTQWDLSASYEFKDLPTTPQITLNVINLTGETQRSTQQFANSTLSFYDPGYSILLGLRGKF
jgi:outer membrane receptor protein involved in Fe transport